MFRFTLFFILTLSSSRAVGADEKPLRTINITGTSTLEVAPDQAVLSLTLKTVNERAAVVADDHNALVAKATNAILELGLKRDDLSTSNMTFGENRVQKKEEWVVQGFVASSEMSFKLRDLTKYVPLWKALATIPGVSISGIRFDHSKRMTHQEESRMKALAVATRKAEVLATACKCRLGPPVSIRESSPPELLPAGWNVFGSQFSQQVQGFGAEDVTSGSAGKIHVKATIDIVFELLPIKD